MEFFLVFALPFVADLEEQVWLLYVKHEPQAVAEGPLAVHRVLPCLARVHRLTVQLLSANICRRRKVFAL